MSDGYEYTPWVKHDGAKPAPAPFPNARMLVNYEQGINGLMVPEIGSPGRFDWPGFYWCWKTVKTGWFSSKRQRVCDDPAYAPITHYRYRRPLGMAVVLGLLENLPDTPPDGGSEVVPIKAKPKPHKVKT
jgi:hypothetical protein